MDISLRPAASVSLAPTAKTSGARALKSTLLSGCARVALLALPAIVPLGVGIGIGLAPVTVRADTVLPPGSSTVYLADFAPETTFTVAQPTTISTGANYGVYGNAGTEWTLTNAGTIQGNYSGVALQQGTLTNQATGHVGGTQYGVLMLGNGTVVNYGSIGAGGVGFGSAGVYFRSTGSLLNGGAITGGYHGVYFSGAGTLTNLQNAQITGSGDGVDLNNGGSVTNAGTIAGSNHGVRIYVGAATINNSGLIVGSTFYGVYSASIAAPATIINSGTITGGNAAVHLGNNVGNRVEIVPGGVFNGQVEGGTGTLELAAAPSISSPVPTLSGFGNSFVNFGTVQVDALASWNFDSSNTFGSNVSLVNSGSITNPGSGSIDAGVYLSGAILTNNPGGQITGHYGVRLNGGIVINQGLIQGSAGAGVQSGIGPSVYVYNTATSSQITGTTAGVSIYQGLVGNQGTISGTGANSVGVQIANGYGVNNTGSLSRITGAAIGVQMRYGQVTNQGTIEATGSAGVGIMFTGGAGSVYNSGAIIGNGGTAVQFSTNAFNNFLDVLPGASFVGVVDAGGGGTVEFNRSGTLAGLVGSEYINFTRVGGGADVTLTNDASFGGVSLLGDRAVLSNTGTLTGAGNYSTVLGSGTGNIVTNTGSINATGNNVDAIQLIGQSGTVSNSASGRITASGTGGSGVVLSGQTDFVANYGTISATGPSSAGVSVTDGSTVLNSGLIAGYSTGVAATNSTVTNTNLGVIHATGTASVGVRATNASVANSGSITSSGTAVALFSGGQLYNAATGTIQGGSNGVTGDTNGAVTVTNQGAISGAGASSVGVYLSRGTLTNSGTAGLIVGGQIGVRLISGTVTNGAGALISGASVGVSMGEVYAFGNVLTNAGTIKGTGTAGVGFLGSFSNTLINSGTIIGQSGTAVQFLAGNNLLVLKTGSEFDGLVNGSAGTSTNTLEFGYNADVSQVGLGTTFINFGTVGVAAGVTLSNSGSANVGIVLMGNNAVFANSTASSYLLGGNSAAVLAQANYDTVSNLGTIAARSGETGIQSNGRDSVVDNSGLITATGTGGSAIVINGYYNTVHNRGSIAGYTAGVSLSKSGTVINDVGASISAIGSAGAGILTSNYATVSITNSGVITGAAAGIESPNGFFRITNTNAGTITATGTNGIGIYLGRGGSVFNDGTIVGAVGGIVANTTRNNGSVVNTGVIQGTLTNSDGIRLSIGSVTNANTGLVEGDANGVEFTQYGVVLNSGTIQATGTNGVGVLSAGRFSLTNAVGGTISGAIAGVKAVYGTATNQGVISGNVGVEFTGGRSTVANTGTIMSTAGAGGTAVQFASNDSTNFVLDEGTFVGSIVGGTGLNVVEFVGNQDLVNGIPTAIGGGTLVGFNAVGAASGVTLTNSSGTFTAPVFLAGNNAALVNLTGATIAATYNAVYSSAAYVVVNNQGTIASTSGAGINLRNSGTVINGAGGSISSSGSDAVYLQYGTVSNTGIISSSGSNGVYIENGGTVINSGSIVSTAAAGVRVRDSGGVQNSGYIRGGSDGVYNKNGSVVNSSTGRILATGDNGVGVATYFGTINNSGLISATGTNSTGVLLGGNGRLDNSGTIQGSLYGVLSQNYGGATVNNQGTIIGSSATNGVGVVFTSGGDINRLDNSGTIIGNSGTSVRFANNGINILVDETSGVFLGGSNPLIVGGTNALNAVEFTGSQILTALPTTIGGATLVNFNAFGAAAGVTLTNTGSIANTVLLDGAGATIYNTGTGTIAATGTSSAVIGLRAGVVVNNAGTISSVNSYGVSLTSSGLVTNRGMISGTTGVFTDNYGTVDNSGTILGTQTSRAAVHFDGYNGILINSGLLQGTYSVLLSNGSVQNSGAIVGDVIGVVSGGNRASIVNTGTGSITGGIIGASFNNSGTVTNAGTIAGARYGVFVNGGAFVTNSGVIAAPGTSGGGYGLRAGGLTLDNSGTIAGYSAGIRISYSGTVVNSGTIIGTNGSSSIGIRFNAGSSSNASSVSKLDNTGTIIGTGTNTHTAVSFYDGINILVAEATGVFVGDVVGSTSNNAINAVELKSSGALVAQTIANVNLIGFDSVAAAAGVTLTNEGAIFTGSVVLDGANAALVNKQTGTIVSPKQYGIFATTGGVSITNAGSISANTAIQLSYGGFVSNTGTITGVTGVRSVGQYGGGSLQLNNSGLISGTYYGVRADYVPAAITNSGTILGGNRGVWLRSGGTVVNSGTIIGTTGVYISGNRYNVGKLDNTGTIIGNGGTAARFTGIGILVPDTGTFDGAVVGTGSVNAIEIGAAGYHTLAVQTMNGVTGFNDVAAGAGVTLGNQGTFAHAVVLDGQGATLDNFAGGVIGNSRYGVFGATAGVAVNNQGTIAAVYGTAISLSKGGAVANYGAIYGKTGISGSLGAVSIVNTGTITGSDDSGISLRGSYSGPLTTLAVTNTGSIVGSGVGVFFRNVDAQIANTGANAAISGGTAGIYSRFDATNTAGTATTIVNSGTISGTGTNGIGIRFVADASSDSNGNTVSPSLIHNTVVNSGTIIGNSGTAVSFGTGNNLLVVDPGAKFVGVVDGGLGVNTIEFGISGTIANLGLGTEYLNFANVTVGDNATLTNTGSFGQLTLSGTNAGVVNAAGATLAVSTYNAAAVVGNGAGASVSNAGTISSTGTYGAGVALYAGGNVTNSGAITGGSVGGQGVVLGGGSVTNQSGGVIAAGGFGVIGSAPITVNNAGLIQATNASSAGVFLVQGGVVNNSASGQILADGVGVRVLAGVATITNHGTIIASGANGIGVQFTGAASGTVDNFGVIGGTSGTAISFSTNTTGANKLILEQGSTLGGIAYGGAAGNTNSTLVVGAGATLTGVTVKYFNTVQLDGAQTIDTSSTVYNPVVNQNLTNQGTLGGAVNVSSGIVVSNTGVINTTTSSNNAGTISNSGTINNTSTLTNNGSLGNTGTIISTGGTLVNAGTFVNSGGVTGDTDGLTNSGSLVNTGTIVGTSGTGVILTGGTLTNMAGGYVKGGTYGVVVGAGATVSNAGTILDDAIAGASLASNASFSNATTGTVGGVTGVRFTGLGASFTNNGTITGSGGVAVQFDAGVNTLTLDTGSVLNGSIDGGSGAGIINLTGTGAMSNTIAHFGASSALNVATGANWTASGSWTIANVTNAGTFQPGTTGNHLRLTGDFTQTSTGIFQVALDEPTNGGSELEITGKAALAGSVSVVPNGTFLVAKTYDILSASGGITGTFSGGVTTTSALLAPTLTYDGNKASVILAQLPVASPPTSPPISPPVTSPPTSPPISPPVTSPPISPPVTSPPTSPPISPPVTSPPTSPPISPPVTSPPTIVETTNQHSVAVAFDAGLASNPTGFATAIRGLDQLNAAGVKSALDRLSGESHGSLATTALISGTNFVGQFAQQGVLARMGASGTASGQTAMAAGGRQELARLDGGTDDVVANIDKPWGVWTSGYGQVGQISGDGNAHRLDETVTGGAVGADYKLTPALRVGASIGYGGTTFSLDDGGGRGQVDHTQFALYADYTAGPAYIDGTVGFAYGDGTTRRNVSLPGLAGQAQGSTSDTQLLGGFEAGYALPMGLATLTPFVGMSFATVDQDGFTETGAGVLDLHVAKQSQSSVKSLLGTRLTADLPLGFALVTTDVSVGWAHEFAPTNRGTTAAFTGAPAAGFQVSGAKVAGDSAQIGFGLATALFANTSIYLHYDGDMASNATSNAVTAGFRFSW